MNLFTGKVAGAVGAHTLGVRPEHLDIDERAANGGARFGLSSGSEAMLSCTSGHFACGELRFLG
jgi:multiple sugar transport system ATP-binding protein